MADNFLSTKEVAEILDVSEQYVRKLLRDKEIMGTKLSNTWVITEDALDQYQNPEVSECQPVSDHPRQSKKTPKHTVLSFFTGAMGLDLGLEEAGFETVLASEIDKACRETIEANRPDIALIGDIRDYSANEIRKEACLGPKDEIDIIVGGPPCQAFSTAGKRLGFNDERGNVFLKYIDLLLELKPKYAVLENVRGLLSAPLQHRPHDLRGEEHPSLTKKELRGGALLYIVSMLRKGGYSVSFNLYNSANYGSPQIRERVVIICSRDGARVPYLKPTHSESASYGLPKWKTFREAIKGLPRKPKDYVKFPEKRLKYYRMLKAGENWRALPTKLQKEALGKSYFAGGGKTGFLRRIAWNKPTPTLVTHPAMPATDLAHPKEDRPLSVQEYKRGQEFPDDWIICGSIIDQYKQIGNAVPVSLGKAIGKAIKSHMNGRNVKEFLEFPYSRYKKTDEKSWERAVVKELGGPIQHDMFVNEKDGKKRRAS